MPHENLVNYCYENYDRPRRCDDCPNDPCFDNCGLCLDYIHRVGTHDRTYNCGNIIKYYTCKYIYRYSTEIEYLLNRYTRAFRNVRNVRIWSIGCGPCTELFGLYRFRNNNDLNFTIQYKGFELNELWTPIHDFIHQMDCFETEFYIQDVFDYIKSNNEHPHIIILNYLLSDILRTNRDYIDKFINNLCDWYAPMINTFLIINDINLGQNDCEARYYYNIIVQKIKDLKGVKSLRIVKKFHFANSQSDYYKYGDLHSNNQVQIQPPNEIITFYNPWLECRSAQLVIF